MTDSTQLFFGRTLRAETPLSQRQIRERAGTRPATVAAALEKLIREHRAECASGAGYRFAGG